MYKTLLAAVTPLLLVIDVAPAVAATGTLEIRIVDKASGKPLACRIHLADAAGKPQQAADLPFFRDHFSCPGSVQLELPAGQYRCQVERGPEYSRVERAVSIATGEKQNAAIELSRLVDLAAEGWWSADLHVHRPVKDIELLMQAEDLHLAPVITWWNNRNEWSKEPRLPEKPLIRFDENRFYHLMAGEDEREGGALLYFNLAAPLVIAGSSREYPSPLEFLHAARKHAGLWVDIEKPFWWDVPIWLADGKVDSIGIANNHMCRSEMRDAEAWGKPRNRERFPPPHGNGYWTQEIYYHILNAGLRIPPSAGSASGVLPNPVGYNRVYVYVEPPFSYERFWEGLKAGRAFVTNGPLLSCRIDGHLPGHVFSIPKGKELTLEPKIELTARDPVRAIEIVQNGKVVRSVPYAEWKTRGTLGTIAFNGSGWLLVRAIEENPTTFRFASTGPYYVEADGAPRRVSKTSAKFFLDWVDERSRRVKLDDVAQRQAVLAHHERARKFWLGVLASANAEDKSSAELQSNASGPAMVRVAGIVLKWVRQDKEANLRRIKPLVRQAAANGAKIVVTTECFLDGYAIADHQIPLETYQVLGEPIPTGKFYRQLAALAKELGIHLVAGLHEVEGERHYNTAVLIDPQGQLAGKYRKQELGHELDRNTPGSRSLVVDTPYGRAGMMICADRTKPEIVRTFRENGADFLICPSGGMFGPKSNDPILQARSQENKLPIVFVHPAEFLVTRPDGSIAESTVLGDKLLVQSNEIAGEQDVNHVFYVDLPIAEKNPR